MSGFTVMRTVQLVQVPLANVFFAVTMFSLSVSLPSICNCNVTLVGKGKDI